MQYQIISDSSCDLPKDYVEENQIEIVPFYVSFDGENYYKEGIEVDHEDFYYKMINDHAYPKSSLPAVQDYVDAFIKYAKQNVPIICICITSKFSGSYQSALNAKNIVHETYPEAKITVIDSTINTVLQGLYVREAVRILNDGISYEDCIQNLERIKSSGRIIFTIENMDYLKQGGILAYEVGHDQAEDVSEIMKSYGYTKIYKKKDIQGIDRVVIGFKL